MGLSPQINTKLNDINILLIVNIFMAEIKKIETFVIISKKNEKERYTHFLTQVEKYKLHEILNIHYFNHCWKSDITQEIRERYCKSDWTMRKHGRNMKDKPLTNGEISLFLNFIECLRNIRTKYNSGYFLILESDVIFRNTFYNKKLDEILNDIKNISDLDILNIGTGEHNYLFNRGYPKTNPIIVNNNKYYKENINKCTEAIIWKYRAICKFLDYFEKDELIDGACDTKMDVLSTYIGGFNIYWSEPIIYQGSLYGFFKTNVFFGN